MDSTCYSSRHSTTYGKSIANRWLSQTQTQTQTFFSYVCLWLLVVETLIFNIISQRARAMMTSRSR